MKCFNSVLSGLWTLAMSVILYSCMDKNWQEHYEQPGVDLPDTRISEYIRTSDLNLFAQMLEKTGYDKFLSYSQAYTVWAPVDAALEHVDMNDMEKLEELVKNHIARYSISTQSGERDVYMLSGKRVVFAGNTFGPCHLTEGNIRLSNGVLHKIDACVPYSPNIWEYLDRIPGLDSVARYLFSLDEKKFDVYSSPIIEYLSDGRPVYDSIFYNNNEFLRNVADLDQEDTTFTVLMPDNEAWEKAYRSYAPYYRCLEEDGGEAAQQKMAWKAMLSNIAFSGRIESPYPDSIFSTGRNVLYQLSDLFAGAQKYEASNGLLYVCDSLKITPEKTIYNPIRIEAEESRYGRTGNNVVLGEQSYTDSVYSVSAGRYLEISASADAALTASVTVDFPIPNVLAAKYNVYCVFVPENAYDKNSTKTNKVTVFMSYVDEKGKHQKNKSMLTNAEVGGTEVTKLFVKQLDFSYCDMYDKNTSLVSDIKTTVRIRNQVRRETKTNTTVLRVDCILLEPVVESEE